jgi:hypothetical protein
MPKGSIMKFLHTNCSSLFVVLFAFTLAPLLLAAQQVDTGISARMTENSEQLRQYTHLRKTEVYWREKLRKTQYVEVKFDGGTGNEVSVPLGSSDGDKSGPQMGGPISILVTKKIAGDVKHNVEQLSALLKEYIPLNMQKGNYGSTGTESQPASSNNAETVLRDYARLGDSMTISFDPDSRLPTQVRITSNLDEEPVTFDIEFASLADRTSYPSTVDMKWDAKKLELRITNSDYHK